MLFNYFLLLFLLGFEGSQAQVRISLQNQNKINIGRSSNINKQLGLFFFIITFEFVFFVNKFKSILL